MLCSRAGIARMPGGEVYITESCIGCGICAERCPYDNITIVSLADETEEITAWQRSTHLFTKRSGQQPGHKPLPIAQGSAAPRPPNDNTPIEPLNEMRKNVAIQCKLSVA